MSTPDIDYLCVGICRIDPESGSCLGCGRPSSPTPESEPPAADVSRYPVASELTLDVPPDVSDAWVRLV